MDEVWEWFMPKLLPRVFHSITLPVNCRNCGFNIGGTREAPAKKSRLNQPGAVLVYENTNEKVFSVNTITRDDRCFVVKKEAILCVLTSACRGHTFAWKSPNESMLAKTSFKLANT